jgi:2,4-dienoyl-CoA reductase-like NADH-dependent reductase (Old Yellow Enzyme family)
VDIDLNSVGPAACAGIPIDTPFEGERFERFQQLAAAGKKDGSLFVAQVNHPGRHVRYKANPVAISASDVQLGEYLATPSQTTAD